jgi:hypothetical protein
MEPYDAVTIPHNGTVAPMSLWEYEHTVLTDVVTVLAFDFAESPSNAEATVVLPVTRGGAWNGVVSWVVFDDDDDSSHSHRHSHSNNDSANSTKGGCTSAQDPPGHSPKGSSNLVPPWPRGYERPAVQFVPQVIVGADESCAVSLTACFVAATCEVTWHASLVAWERHNIALRRGFIILRQQQYKQTYCVYLSVPFFQTSVKPTTAGRGLLTVGRPLASPAPPLLDCPPPPPPLLLLLLLARGALTPVLLTRRDGDDGVGTFENVSALVAEVEEEGFAFVLFACTQ